jgi:alkylhydroperoxidase/carboxymuconolactone decarboxylase family protein YurZ
MKQQTNVFDVFRQEAPAVFSAYNGLIQSLIETKGLDAKTKQLLYIAMKIVTADKTAVMFHIPMAKKAGATRDEIRDTVLLTITVNGLKGLEYLPSALDIYDSTMIESSIMEEVPN